MTRPTLHPGWLILAIALVFIACPFLILVGVELVGDVR